MKVQFKKKATIRPDVVTRWDNKSFSTASRLTGVAVTEIVSLALPPKEGAY